MIHLGAAVLCDAATIRENLLQVLGAGISQLVRGNYPAPLGADIALMLYLDGDPDGEVQHRVSGECRLQDKTGEPVFGFEYTLRTTIEPGLGAQSVSAVIPATALGLPAPGSYEISIKVDGSQIGVIPFTAILDQSLPEEHYVFQGPGSS